MENEVLDSPAIEEAVEKRTNIITLDMRIR